MADVTAPQSSAARGVRVGLSGTTSSPDGYGEFHMHGGIIRIDASPVPGLDPEGLRVEAFASGDAVAHVVDTAFAFKRG